MDINRLFNSVPGAIVVVSRDYKIIAATDAYQKVSLRKREQILGQHLLLEAFPDKTLPYEENPVKLGFDKAVETKEEVNLGIVRYDITIPEQEERGYDVRYWEIACIPVLDEAGEVDYLMQTAIDVTERELAKLAVTEGEEKFRFIADAMPQLIFTTDSAGKVTYFNKRWENYTGLTLEELLQDNWHEVVHPEDVENTKAKWEQAFSSGTEMQVKLRKRDKDGDYRWHICRSLPMKDESGNITMWVGSSTDIHDTRKMVQELLETNEQMALLSDQVQQAYEKAESERKNMEILMMKAPAMFVVLSGPDHRFKLLNDKYQQLYPGRNLIGQPLGEALPDIKAQGFIKLLDNVYNTGETYVAEEVLIMLPKDGIGPLEEHYFNFSYQPTYEADKITGILAFGYDITNEVLFKKKLQELSRS
ncbi:PAS domain-containing protein [Pontibacter harenae]|uniref:PAS domain-containing protein n=1 Tax=Pontibacter harenae TaxID=2894083 RepID=UPI001E33167A|nr:PAS domain-containing protein [Pontibacter harenae]MCC9165738.1 PAS domain-containing protein [Pontibacter harenae]